MNYTDIGHDASVAPPARGSRRSPTASELWWWRGGVVRHRPKSWDEINHHQVFRRENFIPPAYGRIDHKQKKISVIGDNLHPAYDRAIGKLQGDFPEYAVHEFSTSDPARAEWERKLKGLLSIGHAPGSNSELWWHVPGRGVIKKKMSSSVQNHLDDDLTEEATMTGRIDHDQKKISMAHFLNKDWSENETVKRAVRRQLESDHPGYEVHEFGSSDVCGSVGSQQTSLFASSTSDKAYLDIGHRTNSNVWWHSRGKGLKIRPGSIGHDDRREFQHDWRDDLVTAHGRIDHSKKLISMSARRYAASPTIVSAIKKQLQQDYPGYEVHEFSSPKKLPSNYYDVGHDDDSRSDLWWHVHGGTYEKVPAAGGARHDPFTIEDSIAYGRIDHPKKQISYSRITGTHGSESVHRALQEVLRRDHPGYALHETDSGYLSGDEFASGFYSTRRGQAVHPEAALHEDIMDLVDHGGWEGKGITYRDLHAGLVGHQRANNRPKSMRQHKLGGLTGWPGQETRKRLSSAIEKAGGVIYCDEHGVTRVKRMPHIEPPDWRPDHTVPEDAYFSSATVLSSLVTKRNRAARSVPDHKAAVVEHNRAYELLNNRAGRTGDPEVARLANYHRRMRDAHERLAKLESFAADLTPDGRPDYDDINWPAWVTPRGKRHPLQYNDKEGLTEDHEGLSRRRWNTSTDQAIKRGALRIASGHEIEGTANSLLRHHRKLVSNLIARNLANRGETYVDAQHGGAVHSFVVKEPSHHAKMWEALEQINKTPKPTKNSLERHNFASDSDQPHVLLSSSAEAMSRRASRLNTDDAHQQAAMAHLRAARAHRYQAQYVASLGRGFGRDPRPYAEDLRSRIMKRHGAAEQYHLLSVEGHKAMMSRPFEMKDFGSVSKTVESQQTEPFAAKPLTYLDIGHPARHAKNKDGHVWSLFPGSGIEEDFGTHGEYAHGGAQGQYHGRIDHDKKAISVASGHRRISAAQESHHQRVLERIEKYFATKYPGYTIHHFHRGEFAGGLVADFAASFDPNYAKIYERRYARINNNWPLNRGPNDVRIKRLQDRLANRLETQASHPDNPEAHHALRRVVKDMSMRYMVQGLKAKQVGPYTRATYLPKPGTQPKPLDRDIHRLNRGEFAPLRHKQGTEVYSWAKKGIHPKFQKTVNKALSRMQLSAKDHARIARAHRIAAGLINNGGRGARPGDEERKAMHLVRAEYHKSLAGGSKPVEAPDWRPDHTLPEDYYSFASNKSVAYRSIGHGDSDRESDLWWIRDGRLSFAPCYRPGLYRTVHHVDILSPKDWTARGRIDHAKKKISVQRAVLLPSDFTQPDVDRAKEQLRRDWPKYKLEEFSSFTEPQDSVPPTPASWLHGQTGKFHPLGFGEEHHQAARRLWGLGMPSVIHAGHVRLVHNDEGDEGTYVIQGRSSSILKHKAKLKPMIAHAIKQRAGIWIDNDSDRSTIVETPQDHARFWDMLERDNKHFASALSAQQWAKNVDSYMSIGHSGRDVELWYHQPGQGLIKMPKGVYLHPRTFEKPPEALGRIDHAKKQISYSKAYPVKNHTLHAALKKQLLSENPGYELHEFGSRPIWVDLHTGKPLSKTREVLGEWSDHGGYSDTLTRSKKLANILKRMPRYSGKVYRGIYGMDVRGLKPGQVLLAKRHVSLSKSKQVGEDFARFKKYSDTGERHLVELRTQSARSIEHAVPAEWKHQREAVLPMGTKVQFLGKKRKGLRSVYSFKEVAPETKHTPGLSFSSGRKYFVPSAFIKQSSKSRERLISMHPATFLKLAAHCEFNPVKTATVEQHLGHLDSVPMLAFEHDGEGNARVIGHEGRHRAKALLDRGVTKMPVVLHSRAGAKGQAIRWGMQGSKTELWDVVKGTWPKTLHGEDARHSEPFPVKDLRHGQEP